jgi:hypothetical protein
LCPGDPCHASNASCAVSHAEPPARFSPAPPGYPQSTARLYAERPNESVCEKVPDEAMSLVIHAAVRFSVSFTCSPFRPFSCR